ncbi:DUF7289 family protein [Halocatena marina]|uniref:Type IV pilin n=1 Tax=Halocatena marina TaxID=2934937 RepID=A0ABD5YHT7_9EURY|nr:type IV pilin [Halocatena marina]
MSQNTKPDCNRSTRAQSHVIGVALLLGVAVISMSALTASVGVLIEQQTTSADATRVADEMDTAFSPAKMTGTHHERLSFSEGTLRSSDRQLRLLTDSNVVRTVDVNALVFTTGNSRVAFVSGAIVRGSSGNAWLHTEPPITRSSDGDMLIVGTSKIGTTDAVSGAGGVIATLRTNVTHTRKRIGNGTYAVAIETETPKPFVRYFSDWEGTVERRDIDGDGIESVIATLGSEQDTYLVIHDFNTEVNSG